MKLSANNIVLKILGLLLLTGAALKGHELLTTPMANADIWTNRYFMIFVVEFELALGIWLLSGLFKRAAWLVTLGCFALFCGVTLYKGLSGAASCGCFGNVHVNPWITLFAIDLPAVMLLAVFRPKLENRRILHIPHWLEPLPRLSVFAFVFCFGLSAIAVSSPVLILNEPAAVTSTYEVFDPEPWLGSRLPILEYIDVNSPIGKGRWLLLLYNPECYDCQEAIRKFELLGSALRGNGQMNIGCINLKNDSGISFNIKNCLSVKTSKRIFAQTPLFLLIKDGVLVKIYEHLPDIS